MRIKILVSCSGLDFTYRQGEEVIVADNLAKELCENYMRKDIIEPMPEAVRQAQLLVISHFYENRSGGSVPDTVYRLLDAYRKEVF